MSPNTSGLNGRPGSCRGKQKKDAGGVIFLSIFFYFQAPLRAECEVRNPLGAPLQKLFAREVCFLSFFCRKRIAREGYVKVSEPFSAPWVQAV